MRSLQQPSAPDLHHITAIGGDLQCIHGCASCESTQADVS